jgi:hypothetical protein
VDEQIVAFRLARHGLTARAGLGEAVSAIGVQDSPPGAAATALHARVRDFAPGDLERALEDDRTLLATYNARTAVSVLAVADAPAFLSGQSLAEPPAGVAAGTAAMREALDGRRLSRDELHAELRERLPKELLPWCEGCQSFHVKRWLLVAACLSGDMCLAGRIGRQPAFARPVDWLGAPLAEVDVEAARAELVRAYLRRYGPSTPRHYAEWTGMAPADARAAWALVEDEIEDGLLAEDAAAFASPPAMRGVRLLGAGDPFLLARDRETLFADPAVRKRVWTAIGGPGVVISDGRPAGLWRARKKGKRLEVAVEALDAFDLDSLTEEARGLAEVRYCTTFEVRPA